MIRVSECRARAEPRALNSFSWRKRSTFVCALKGHAVYVVQKQTAALGFLYQSIIRRHCTRERSTLVAEELVFEQV